jgi:hypothetical protein
VNTKLLESVIFYGIGLFPSNLLASAMDDSSQLWMLEDEKSIQEGIKKWKRLLQRALEKNPVKIEKYVKVAMEVVDIAAQTFGRKVCAYCEYKVIRVGYFLWHWMILFESFSSGYG